MIKLIEKNQLQELKRMLGQRNKKNKTIEVIAQGIVDKVEREGDKALLYYTKKFDSKKITSQNMRVSQKEINEAYTQVDKKKIQALKKAIKNIKRFSQKQLPKGWQKEFEKGLILGEVVKPLDSAGLYIPAGQYPLVSTVLMNAIPAKVAKVKKIVVCTPPNKEGKTSPEILVACDLCGVDEIFKVGGAQAIAALAYGTETIPAVNKIVGPGNVFVTAAKKIVFGKTGIDFPAGPTELMVIADKGRPDFIAADLLAQAEHDANAASILVTTKRELAQKVQKEVSRQVQELSTKQTALKSLESNCAILLVKTLSQAAELANAMAPEHLELITSKDITGQISNAGALFQGEYSCESFGDYCSGSNHVLPTNGFARVRGGLSALDFVKVISFQKISRTKARELAGLTAILADMEQLDGHKKAALFRK